MSCIKQEKIRHNPDIIASTIIEMICNDLKFHDMQNDTEYVLLNSVLKEQKKIQEKQRRKASKMKKMTEEAKKRVRENSGISERKPSKFKEKYKDRVESIQNIEAKIEENRKIAEEIAKMEKGMREAAKMLDFEYASVLRDRIKKLREELNKR